MTRRLLKQRYMASLHGRQGHCYRVYLSKETVQALQTIYEHNPFYGNGLRVQDIASLFLEADARDEAIFLRRHYE